MTIDDMESAVRSAEDELRRANAVATKLARLLKGRLRQRENGWVLAQLKKELSQFNAVTRTWKDKE